MISAQVVLITGAASGIGQATSELLSAQGYRIFGTSRAPKPGAAHAASLLSLNVHSDESVQTCVQSVLEQAGRIDVLINNAGTGLSGAVEETRLAEAQSVFATKFLSMTAFHPRSSSR